MKDKNKTNNHSVRIIAGQYRGRRLPVLDAQGLRPTSDRVRETLFNWLMFDIAGRRCLDLFAGSGALGFECASRGADVVHLVESNKKVASELSQNIERLQAKNSAALIEVHATNALSYLSGGSSEPFDLIFLDPPFQSDLLQRSIDLLEQNNFINDDALIYVEHASNDLSPVVPPSWQLKKNAVAGQSAYFLYHRSREISP